MDVLIYALAAVAACLIGWLLLRVGKSRRVGDAPHCRQCGYCLTGLAGDRCPECGGPAADRVIGERRRHPWLPWLGRILVGLGICLTLWAGRRAHERSLHEWYQYRPFFLVLRDLKSGDWEMIFHASTQMLRWLEAGGLSPSQKARVVSVVLAQMKANPLSRGVWTGPAAFVPDARGCFLGKMLLADELDERSTREFLMIPNVFELTIMARPKGFWGLGIRSPLSQIPAKRRLLLRVQVELSERDGQQVLPRQVMASYMLTVHRVDGQPIDDSLHTTHQGDVFPPAFESMVFRVRTAWYLTGLGEASKLPEWATSPVAMADFRRMLAAKSTRCLAEFEDAVKVDDSNGWDAVVPQTPATGPATRPAAGPRDRPL